MRPDPWAVVEHHARADAAGPADDDDLRRLALYAAAAPQVIGARALRPGETGILGPIRDAAGHWCAPQPGSPHPLAWNAAGMVFVRDERIGARIVIASLAFVLTLVPLLRLAGPRAAIAALIPAVAAFAAARLLLAPWRPVGAGEMEPVRGTVASFVRQYEAALERE